MSAPRPDIERALRDIERGALLVKFDRQLTGEETDVLGRAMGEKHRIVWASQVRTDGLG